jgi:hypothetical protein
MIARARRSRSWRSGSATEVWCRRCSCFIGCLQLPIVREEPENGETTLLLHCPLQLLHPRVDHQVNRFVGCDYHIEQGFKVSKRGGWQWQRTCIAIPAAGGAVVVSRGGCDLVAAQHRGNGRSDDSGEHAASTRKGRRPTFPTAPRDTITPGQCLSPRLDHYPSRTLQSAPPPAWALRARALAPPQGQSNYSRILRDDKW